jgi:hypothetical protein
MTNFQRKFLMGFIAGFYMVATVYFFTVSKLAYLIMIFFLPLLFVLLSAEMERKDD